MAGIAGGSAVMMKSVILVGMLLASVAAHAAPAIWEPDFGTPIVSGDDNTTTAGFGFAFPLFGSSFTSFEASTNGFISVGGQNGQGCCTGYAGGLLAGAARIAPQWFDWVDTVYLNTAIAGRAVVTWQGFEYYNPAVAFTTQAQMFDSGKIVFGFDGPSVPVNHQSLTGVSIGSGAADPGGVSLLGARSSTGTSFYQEFAPGTFNLNGTNVVITPRNGGLDLDAGAVPEPASWAMMIVGFGLIGAAARRRSAAAGQRPAAVAGTGPLPG